MVVANVCDLGDLGMYVAYFGLCNPVWMGILFGVLVRLGGFS